MALQFGSGEFDTFDYPQAERRLESLPQSSTVSIPSKKASADSKYAIWGTLKPKLDAVEKILNENGGQ